MKTIVAIVLLLSATSLQAVDCTNTKIVAGSSFFYSLCDVPDIDQRRAANSSVIGLLNNGEMYCLPASAMDFARSFSNFDPRIHTGPGWRNVLPRETRDSSR